MQKKNILSSRTAEILSKILLGEFKPNEIDELQHWLDESPANTVLLKEILNEDELERLGLFYRTLDVDANLKAAMQKAGIARAKIVQVPKFTTKPWLLLAACTIIAVCGFLLFSRKEINISQKTIAVVPDINPGHSGATLTLSDGSKIQLEQATTGELANESGIAITKTADGQLRYEPGSSDRERENTLSTEKGQMYSLQLPDGTVVWLNSASTLTYSTNMLAQDKRIVKLTGEAYFEVAHKKDHPFIVKTNQQEIEVLGTHFNVNSYENESFVATTLIQGSVRLKAGGKTKMLSPGEEARFNGTSVNISSANIETALDWKDGEFSFGHVNFRMAMRKIERWYDVEFIYDSTFPADLEGGGWISRNNKLSAVLQFIESTHFARFKITGKKVYITKY